MVQRYPSWYNSLLYPLLFLNLLMLAWKSFQKTAFGSGVLWKGRVVK
ncbi:hypothetical protein ES703_55529 [subsurface metagenome]